jgi:adenosine deaminase
MSPILDLCRALPKCELHLHIEGSLEPELMFALAKRNNVEIPYKSVEEVRAAYKFTNLQSFLDIYYAGASVLLKREDFADLAYAYVKRAAQDNLRHAEVFFDPQTHTDRGVAMETVVRGLQDGFKKGQDEFGVTIYLIFSFLRHLSEEAGFQVLELAKPFLKDFHAVGLDSSEVGHPPEKFSKLFAECRRLGLKTVAHAGEEGPPAYIWGALNDLQVVRIDHGVRCVEDEKLVAELISKKIPLTVCPTSNIALRVFDKMKDHNIIQMLHKGLHVTTNSDDPAYFGGYVGANYELLVDCGLTAKDACAIARNGFTASWLPDDRKAAFIAEIDALEKKYTA